MAVLAVSSLVGLVAVARLPGRLAPVSRPTYVTPAFQATVLAVTRPVRIALTSEAWSRSFWSA
jgi:hypothetical protein